MPENHGTSGGPPPPSEEARAVQGAHMNSTARSPEEPGGRDRTSEHTGQNVQSQPRLSPESSGVTDSRFEDLRIRDRSTPPADRHSSATQKSRKRSATLAEHIALNDASSGGHKLNKGKNSPNASPRKADRRGILTPKRVSDQIDPDFDRGESWRPPVPATLFNPDLDRTKKPRASDVDSQVKSTDAMQDRPIATPNQEKQPGEFTSAAAIAAAVSAQTQTATDLATASSPESRPRASSSGTTQRYCMDSQPETRPISEAQLVNEVRGIYAGLVMVEKKCVEIDKQQANAKKEISNGQWQALIALHRTLLHEHHDFFLASQHPAASQALQKLATKYAMPARMWRHGIHSFLELLRHRLPGSLDHMLTFIYTAYSMMTLLMESVSTFQDTWIECLGDIARYRMAIEDADVRDREIWAGVARYWYRKTVDRNPNVGRIRHHLAVLARPNILRQLFFYTKSLVCVQAFPNTRDSILLLFNPILHPSQGQEQPHHNAVVAFVKLHGILFVRQSMSSFVTAGDEFISFLDAYISEGFRYREQGANIASVNIASMLEYGNDDGVLMPTFRQALQDPTDRTKIAFEYWSTAPLPSSSPLAQNSGNDSHRECLRYASYFTFQTLRAVLDHTGNQDVVPHIHISLAFLWSLVLVPQAMSYVEAEVPWQKLGTFLNSICREIDMDNSDLQSESFPASSDSTRNALNVPEDLLMRGQSWTCFYYPTGFFNQTPLEDDDERSFESPSVPPRRAQRCIWLGHRIASMNRWIRFDKETQRFEVTEQGVELENLGGRDTVFAQAPTIRDGRSAE